MNKSLHNIKIGTLVHDALQGQFGIVVDVVGDKTIWTSHLPALEIVKVYWSNGRTFWCSLEDIKVFS